MRVPPALVLAALITSPALAQMPHGVAGPPADGGRVRVRVQPASAADRDAADLRRDAHGAREAGQITRWQEKRTRSEAGQLQTLSDRYAEGGLSKAERRELEVRGYVLHDQLSAARNRAVPPPSLPRR